ncbi:MAG: hypothetical protein R3321_15430, partial [Nitrososphaeraceae archaeon]|nr:hypothetical protein [Nitrososphaeraceae archaeon]
LGIKKITYKKNIYYNYIEIFNLFPNILDKITINLITKFKGLDKKIQLCIITVTNRSLDINGELIKWH